MRKKKRERRKKTSARESVNESRCSDTEDEGDSLLVVLVMSHDPRITYEHVCEAETENGSVKEREPSWVL